LSGSGVNRTYTPYTNYEGPDSFQFTVSDGTWSNAATVTIDVTAGPVLYQDCNPFGTAVLLAWMLDTNEHPGRHPPKGRGWPGKMRRVRVRRRRFPFAGGFLRS
jgi:hypothetical protein